MTKNKAIDQLAVMICQEAELHRMCCETDWPKPLESKYKEHKKEVIEFSKKHLSSVIHNMSITGCHEGDVSHRDIDDDIKKKFGDAVSVDSESGQFFAYCNKRNVKKVLTYLNKKYDKKEFNPSVSERDDAIYFGNWTYAQEHAEKNKLSIPALPLDVQKLERFKMVKSEIEKRKKEITEMEKMLKATFA
jgi:hypothetical protein